jgi:hypothetical protein
MLMKVESYTDNGVHMILTEFLLNWLVLLKKKDKKYVHLNNRKVLTEIYLLTHNPHLLIASKE